ncbi:hypothetical protein HW555_007758 [Spodoptera exigua]|uniref:Uncharacterized protein n=1 Tax=Spodoptera exigua TaxID=7107 RepID=A0A835GFM3_SPOEX|nr:hypothetical protein HW555_007758 [Spodoptera exigua]
MNPSSRGFWGKVKEFPRGLLGLMMRSPQVLMYPLSAESPGMASWPALRHASCHRTTRCPKSASSLACVYGRHVYTGAMHNVRTRMLTAAELAAKRHQLATL